MELSDNSIPARTAKAGRQTVEVEAGQRFVIETSPNGQDILDETVPEGKSWTVYINIDIIETDA